MRLQLVLGVHVLLDAVGVGAVDVVPLVDHGRRCLVEQGVDLDARVLGGGALALGPLDVVVTEPGPRLRHARAARGPGMGLGGHTREQQRRLQDIHITIERNINDACKTYTSP